MEDYVGHIYQGFCPDETQPESRDPDCPACKRQDRLAKLERVAVMADNVNRWLCDTGMKGTAHQLGLEQALAALED